jgi:hypothetical protein
MSNIEEQYEATFKSLQNQAKAISDKYEAEHPTCKIKFKEHQTAFRVHAWQAQCALFRGSDCPRCDGTDRCFQSITAGSHASGEDYGAVVIFCRICGMMDWCSWDHSY